MMRGKVAQYFSDRYAKGFSMLSVYTLENLLTDVRDLDMEGDARNLANTIHFIILR
jgi:hypothetical protein